MVAHDENNNANRLAATVVYRPNQIACNLDQLILVLPDGTWDLAEPAQFTKDEHHIAVEHFVLVNGVRHVTLDSSITPAHAQKVALTRARHRSRGLAAADAAGATNRWRFFRRNYDKRNIDRAIDRGKSEHKWPDDEFPKDWAM